MRAPNHPQAEEVKQNLRADDNNQANVVPLYKSPLKFPERMIKFLKIQPHEIKIFYNESVII
jgi:hypothetical protein